MPCFSLLDTPRMAFAMIFRKSSPCHGIPRITPSLYVNEENDENYTIENYHRTRAYEPR
jgi:hypothetical protein